MKKFLKKAEGFTLVELIVVIAILGILAAIAVPTYSGYVKKASEANDTQTLSAANTALAAACTENNVAMANVGEYLTFTDDATNTDAGCTITVTAKTSFTGSSLTGDALTNAATVAAAMEADFETYYGNADGKIVLKYYNNAQPNTVTTDDIPDGNLVGTQPTT